MLWKYFPPWSIVQCRQINPNLPEQSYVHIKTRTYNIQRTSLFFHLRNIWKFCWTGLYDITWVWVSLCLNWPKPGCASTTCSTISNIPYNLIFTTKFNDSSILIMIISCDYLNLSLADEYVGDVTIPTQVIEYNQNFLQAD